eukprot:6471587-Alexandrium_andersonii.AAC.1
MTLLPPPNPWPQAKTFMMAACAEPSHVVGHLFKQIQCRVYVFDVPHLELFDWSHAPRKNNKCRSRPSTPRAQRFYQRGTGQGVLKPALQTELGAATACEVRAATVRAATVRAAT